MDGAKDAQQYKVEFFPFCALDLARQVVLETEIEALARGRGRSPIGLIWLFKGHRITNIISQKPGLKTKSKYMK